MVDPEIRRAQRLAAQARYREKHHDELLAAERLRYVTNDAFRTKRKATIRRWKKENRERWLEIKRSWQKRWAMAKPLEKAARDLASVHARRAKILNVGGRWRKGDVEQLLIAQDGLCALCWLPLDPTYHVDHIRPLARGGSNWPSNLQITHRLCNQSKGANSHST